MASQMPMIMQQMQDPRFQQMLTNPRAMQAMMQVQQGMQSLQSEAPGLFSGPGLIPTPPTTTGTSSTTNSTTPPTTTTTPATPNTTSGTGGTTTTPGRYSKQLKMNTGKCMFLQNNFMLFSATGDPAMMNTLMNQFLSSMGQVCSHMITWQHIEVCYVKVLSLPAVFFFTDSGSRDTFPCTT